MDFSLSSRAQALADDLNDFMTEFVYPAERVHKQQIRDSGDPHFHTPVLEELKAVAKRRGLWNLFLPHETQWTTGLSNLDYATLAEITGRSPGLAAESLNCSAPDTGNMELLTMFGTEDQKQRWLKPLLDGEIRSSFAMTEPTVASSDATNVETQITRVGDEYVINGRKWWISGAASQRCRVLIVMGKTDPSAPRHRQQSMVLVPIETPGVTVVRDLSVFGYTDVGGHPEVHLDDVRVPVSALLGDEGGGFAMAQARLGPGRIHHAMRCIGAAERALELMCQRVVGRSAFGSALADKGVIQQWIADSRIEIEQIRLLTLKTAWLMDTVGNTGARTEISAIKVVATEVAERVVDRAIQAHGAGGVGQDFPLATMSAQMRMLRLADGPNEVHRMQVAKHELRSYRQVAKAAGDRAAI